MTKRTRQYSLGIASDVEAELTSRSVKYPVFVCKNLLRTVHLFMNVGKESPKKSCIFFRVGGIAYGIAFMTRREERRHESPEVRSEERLIFGETSCLLDSVSYEETKKLVLFFCTQKSSFSSSLLSSCDGIKQLSRVLDWHASR